MKDKIVVIFFYLISRLSFEGCQRVGRVIGALVYRFDNKMRNVVEINLSRCLPRLLEKEKEKCVKEVFSQTGMTACESAWVWLRSPEDVLKTVVSVHGQEQLVHLHKQQRGVLIAAPHMGNWEVLGMWLAAYYDCCFMYRPPKMAGLDGLIRRGRESNGAVLVPANQSGVRRLIKELRGGSVSAILPDQEPAKGEGVFARFFGIEAWTMTLLNRLAQHQKMPIVLAYASRCSKGFELHFRPMEDDFSKISLEEGVAALNREIEQEVKKFPLQYQWTYKRFKSRPEKEPPFYP